MENKWLTWAKQLQSIAQSGLEYSKDEFDLERFEQIRKVSIEIMSEYTQMDCEVIRELFANETGYQTPKVGVRGAIFKDDKILLVKEKLDDRWSLPGGWADIGLSIRENIVKEALEEAGAVIETNRLVAIIHSCKPSDGNYPYSIYRAFMDCDYIEGVHSDNIETAAAKFFSLNELPPLSEYRNTLSDIKMCFDAHHNSEFVPIVE